MKKTTKTKTTTKKTAKLPQAPLSLKLLFQLLKEQDHTATAPTIYASRSLPIARRIMGSLHTIDGKTTMDHLLKGVPFIFGNNITGEDAVEPSHVAQAAFQIGVATAWIAMQGVNGREVTR